MLDRDWLDGLIDQQGFTVNVCADPSCHEEHEVLEISGIEQAILAAPEPPADPQTANYMSVSAICFVCRKTAPGMEPEGWATWERRIDATFPLPYFLHTCPQHSTHEGIWAEPPSALAPAETMTTYTRRDGEPIDDAVVVPENATDE